MPAGERRRKNPLPAKVTQFSFTTDVCEPNGDHRLCTSLTTVLPCRQLALGPYKRPGRPKKILLPGEEKIVRPRGRPRIHPPRSERIVRPRGRPRIHPPKETRPKKSPGRPRIHSVKDRSIPRKKGRPKKMDNLNIWSTSHDCSNTSHSGIDYEKIVYQLRQLLTEKDMEIMALRRRLVELGDATHMKSANNTMQESETDVCREDEHRRFVYVNSDGSYQDIPVCISTLTGTSLSLNRLLRESALHTSILSEK